jgi:hypothetical protein
VPATVGAFWDAQESWVPGTALPVKQSLSSSGTTLTGGSGAFQRNDFYERTRDDGFAIGGEATVTSFYTRDVGGRVTQLERRFFGSSAFPPANAVGTSAYVYVLTAASRRRHVHVLV